MEPSTCRPANRPISRGGLNFQRSLRIKVVIKFFVCTLLGDERGNMKFLPVRELRGRSAEVWKELPQEKEMVITRNGSPIAMLTPVTDKTLESSVDAWRKVRAQQALDRLQRNSFKQGTAAVSMEEIDTEIQNSRRDRKARCA